MCAQKKDFSLASPAEKAKHFLPSFINFINPFKSPVIFLFFQKFAPREMQNRRVRGAK
jgi:hypothetical protein